MFDITTKGDESIIPTSQLIDLLRYKLIAFQKAHDEDPTWNYPIDQLTNQIEELEATL